VDSGKKQNGLDGVGSNFGSNTLDKLLRCNGTNTNEENHSWHSGKDRETDGEADSEEHKVKAEAKSMRKVPQHAW
jgi:hypothetical protein